MTDDSNQAGGEMEGDNKEIPIRQFINRTKQIIRDTYDGMMEDGLEREERSLALCAEALSLKNEMTKTYDEFEGMFPIVDGLDLGELLNEATYHIEQTEIYTGDQELEESVESSEQTFSKLVQLYALMQQLEKQKAQGQGQGQPSDSKGKQGEQKEEQAPKNSQDPAEKLEELAKELEDLKELERRQDSLNEEMGKAAGKGQSGKANQDLASDQEGIKRDLQDLRNSKYDRSGKLGDVANLDQAGGEMKEGAGDLRRDQQASTTTWGTCFRGFRSCNCPDRAGDVAACCRYGGQLTKMAEQLGDAQGNLRGETENGGGQGKSYGRTRKASIRGWKICCKKLTVRQER